MDFKSYLLVFTIIFLMYVIFVILRKKSLLKFKKSTYVTYLVNVYKIDVENINPYFLTIMVTLVNSFILSTSLYVVSNVKGMIGILIGFITLMVLIFGMYHILGLILKKKGDKNV